MIETFLDGKVVVKVGDLTLEKVDAIVNAANASLMGGSGVDGAIHARGGPAILDECRAIRRDRFPDGLPTGEAVITTSGKMPSRFVIHTVGPIYGQSGRDSELLAACYENCLRLAEGNQLRTIAFPSISTGVYSFPKDEAALVSSKAIRTYLEGPHAIAEVRLVFHSHADQEIFLDHHVF